MKKSFTAAVRSIYYEQHLKLPLNNNTGYFTNGGKPRMFIFCVDIGLNSLTGNSSCFSDD